MRERPDDALFVATPGAGKTRFATRLAHAMLSERSIERVIVVVPREHLKSQVARSMAAAGVQLDHRFRNVDLTIANDLHGAVVTYQQVAAEPQRFRELARVRTLVILDEIHHAGEQATWGQAMRTAFGRASRRVGLSGTPFRSDGGAIPFVRYHAGECVADFTYDYAHALGDGVCRALVFPLHGGEAEWVSRDGVEDVLERRHMSERLRTALTQPAWLGDVLEKAHLKLLETRALGHGDAGGLVAAMNQEHARFVAGLLEARVGVKPELVVSDLDDASRRIATFSRSRAPWIVAVHMISEGVDIPRLRVGVFASNVVSELYFRQFCGRFVRTGADPRSEREAYVYLPDDLRLRIMASRIAEDVRRSLRVKVERDEVADAVAAAQADDDAGGGDYSSIAATAREGRVLDFGPLFNPAAYLAGSQEAAAVALARPPESPSAEPQSEPQTHAERRDDLRRELRALVSRASVAFNVDHRRLHATLNMRFGGPIAQATVSGLEGRRRVLQSWLDRRSYDGLR